MIVLATIYMIEERSPDEEEEEYRDTGIFAYRLTCYFCFKGEGFRSLL